MLELTIAGSGVPLRLAADTVLYVRRPIDHALRPPDAAAFIRWLQQTEVTEEVDVVGRRAKLSNSKMLRFDAPDGSGLWVNGARVQRVREPIGTELPAAAVLTLGAVGLRVDQSVADVLAMLASVGETRVAF